MNTSSRHIEALLQHFSDLRNRLSDGPLISDCLQNQIAEALLNPSGHHAGPKPDESKSPSTRKIGVDIRRHSSTHPQGIPQTPRSPKTATTLGSGPHLLEALLHPFLAEIPRYAHID